ncbi:MAG: isoprenylcysteine carboxylmethyltransferase family protein [Chitinophagaceae bacterium]
MHRFLPVYLPLFVSVFILLAFIAPSVSVYRQTGINPFRFATRHNALHDYIGGVMKVLVALLLVIAGVYSFLPGWYAYLVPFAYPGGTGWQVAGLVLAHLSLAGIVLAQRQMKQSWRIGIDYENETQLVTTGLFSLSRNPIFLFLLTGLAGLFLIIPNAASLALLCTVYIVLQVSMRLEEDFLLGRHGQAYARYKQKVKRLI